jgi:hypothetical protein
MSQAQEPTECPCDSVAVKVTDVILQDGLSRRAEEMWILAVPYRVVTLLRIGQTWEEGLRPPTWLLLPPMIEYLRWMAGSEGEFTVEQDLSLHRCRLRICPGQYQTEVHLLMWRHPPARGVE